MTDYSLSPDQIAKIRVKTPDKASKLDTRNPLTPEDAQYSIPFALGAAAVDGKVEPPQMSAARLNDPEILAVAARVEIVSDPLMQAAFPERVATVVEITTVSGETFSQGNDQISGDWDYPLSDQNLVDKFKAYAAPALGMKKTDALCNQIMELDHIDNINQLLKPLEFAQ